jgi:hypothetical protein
LEKERLEREGRRAKEIVGRVMAGLRGEVLGGGGVLEGEEKEREKERGKERGMERYGREMGKMLEMSSE